MIAAWVILGGAAGAPLRYLTDRLIQTRHDSIFPWGTLTVNVAGSLMLGLVVGLRASPVPAALLGTGFCGALTTYSTLGYETHRLLQDRALLVAGLNAAASLLGGVAAAGLGLLIAQRVRL